MNDIDFASDPLPGAQMHEALGEMRGQGALAPAIFGGQRGFLIKQKRRAGRPSRKWVCACQVLSDELMKRQRPKRPPGYGVVKKGNYLANSLRTMLRISLICCLRPNPVQL